MRLYALRHGKAGEGFPDSVRELTGRGRRQVESIVARRSEELGKVDLAITSSLVRAQQTLQIVLDRLDLSSEVIETDLVSPGGSCAELAELLADCEAETVLVATHQPFVSDWIFWMTGEDVPISTGMLVAVECELPREGWGELLWIEKPDC